MLGSCRRFLGWIAVPAFVLAACGSTVDSLGYDEAAVGVAGKAGVGGNAGRAGGGNEGGDDEVAGSGGATEPSLRPLAGPDSYPNPFRDELGKTEQQIDDRIASVYRQLFRGDEDEVIFYEEGPGEASIRDILHGDIRTEGIGLGMLIAVQRGERADFDALYTFAKNQLAGSGVSAGYFTSKCDAASGPPVDCFDPYGMQVMTMALVFAHGRWQSDGAIDYEAEALAALDAMLNKQAQNDGTPDGITDMFSRQAKLPFDVPHTRSIAYTRPALAMPGFYGLWEQATGTAFWAEAAEAAREYLVHASHPETGLTPLRTYFDGVPVRTDTGYSDIFEAQSYRTQMNLVLDAIWIGSDDRAAALCDRLIRFFAGVGINKYGAAFELDGTVVDGMRDPALVSVNGAAALVSDHADRIAFMQKVWDMPTVKGEPRYYSGLLTLFSLMVLGGQMQVY
jgi:oligosaccharide reducing-end xylanase